LLALLMFAPAAWVAGAVSRASGGHLMLAEARGSWWQGEAAKHGRCPGASAGRWACKACNPC
jgi:general secretion pathway protein N